MMEKSICATWALSCGARVLGAMSTLSYSDIISPVQFLLDYELVQYMKTIYQGIEVNDDTCAMDVIKRVAPNGANFLIDDHTMANYSKQWLPMFMDRNVAMAWLDNPSTMLDKAAEKAAQLWRNASNKSPLSDAQKSEIEKILKAADHQLG